MLDIEIQSKHPQNESAIFPEKHTEKNATIYSLFPRVYSQPILHKASRCQFNYMSHSRFESVYIPFSSLRKKKNVKSRMTVLKGSINVPAYVIINQSKKPLTPNHILSRMNLPKISLPLKREEALQTLLDNLEHIPPFLIKRLNPTTIKAIPEEKMVDLPKDFFYFITSKQLQMFTTAQWKNISTKQIFQLFKYEKLENLPKKILQSIPENVIAAIPPSEIRSIPMETIPKMHPGQIKALTPQHIQELSCDQVWALTSEQLVNIREEQYKAFSGEQLSSFSADQAESLILSQKHRMFSHEQLIASHKKSFLVQFCDMEKNLTFQKNLELEKKLQLLKQKTENLENESSMKEEIQKIRNDLEKLKKEIFYLIDLLKGKRIPKKDRQVFYNFILKISSPKTPNDLMKIYQEQLSLINETAKNVEIREIKLRSPQEIQQWPPQKIARLSIEEFQAMSSEQLHSLLPEQLRSIKDPQKIECLVFSSIYLTFSPIQFKALFSHDLFQLLEEVKKLDIFKKLSQIESSLKILSSSISELDNEKCEDEELSQYSDLSEKLYRDIQNAIYLLQGSPISHINKNIISHILAKAVEPVDLLESLKGFHHLLSIVKDLNKKLDAIDSERDGLDIFTKLGNWGIIHMKHYKELGINEPKFLVSKLGFYAIRDLRKCHIHNKQEFIAYIQQQEIQEKLHS